MAFIIFFLAIGLALTIFLPNITLIDNYESVATDTKHPSFFPWMTEDQFFGINGYLRILVKPKQGGNALKPAVFLEALDLLEKSFRHSVPYNGSNFSLGQLCLQKLTPLSSTTGLPESTRIQWRSSPLPIHQCAIVSVLDVWNFNRTLIANLTEESIAQTLFSHHHSGQHISHNSTISDALVYQQNGISLSNLNAFSKDAKFPDQKTAFAKSFSMQIPFLPTLNAAGESNPRAQQLFNLEITNYLDTLAGDFKTIDFRFNSRMRRTPLQATQILAFAALVVLYSLLANFKTSFVRSQLALTLGGIFSVCLSLTATLGLLTMMGIGVSVLCIPGFIIVIAIGVDDMFIILNSVMRRVGSARKRFAVGLADASTTITLTSVTDCVIFFCATLSTSKMVQSFGLTIGLALFVDYIFQVNFFGAMMILDLSRQKHNRVDVLCCATCKPSRTSSWKYGIDSSDESWTRTSLEFNRAHDEEMYVFVDDLDNDTHSGITSLTNETTNTMATSTTAHTTQTRDPTPTRTDASNAAMRSPKTPAVKASPTPHSPLRTRFNERRMSRYSAASDTSSAILINEDTLRRLSENVKNGSPTEEHSPNLLGSVEQSISSPSLSRNISSDATSPSLTGATPTHNTISSATMTQDSDPSNAPGRRVQNLMSEETHLAQVSSLNSMAGHASPAKSTRRQLRSSSVFGPGDEDENSEFLKRRSSTLLRNCLSTSYFNFASSSFGKWFIVMITVVFLIISVVGLSQLQIGSASQLSWLRPTESAFHYELWRTDDWPVDIVASVIGSGQVAASMHTEATQVKFEATLAILASKPHIRAVSSILGAMRGFVNSSPAWTTAIAATNITYSASGLPINAGFYLALKTMMQTPGWEWVRNHVTFANADKLSAIRSPLAVTGAATATQNVNGAIDIQNMLLKSYGNDVGMASQFLWLTQSSFTLLEQLLQAVGLAVVFSALFTSFLLINPMGGVFVVSSILFTFTICLGAMGLFGYPLVMEAALALIITSGMSVDAVAHMCHEFFVVPGNRYDRMQQMFGEIAPPVVHGFMTTLAVAGMLPDAKGPIYVIVFIYSISVFAGFWFGFVLSPVLLLWTNPPPALRDLEMQMALSNSQSHVDRKWKRDFQDHAKKNSTENDSPSKQQTEVSKMDRKERERQP